MHVSPLEAFDLMVDMQNKGRWNDTWMERMRQCERDNNLDRPPIWMGNQELRRSYTCPFFGAEQWGCGCAVEQKPYGCIAFNPREQGVKDGGNCRSSMDELQKQRQISTNESEWNNTLKAHFELDWDKRSIPSAILDLWKHQTQKSSNEQQS